MKRRTYFPTGRWTSTAESSARLGLDAETRATPLSSSSRAESGCWLYRAGDRRAHRATNACACDCPVFTWFETRRIGHHAGNRQILRLDIRLVSADCHRGELCLLLRALSSCHLPCGSSPQHQGVTLPRVLDGIRARKGMPAGRSRNDRRGAQLSQECPPPVDNQPMGTNNRTAQCRCLQCGRLFRLGLAIQVVPPPTKSFHRAKRKWPFHWARGGKVQGGRGCPRFVFLSLGLGVDVSFRGVNRAGGLAVLSRSGAHHFAACSAPRRTLESISARQ